MQDQEIDLARSTRWAWRTVHEQLVERLGSLEEGDGLRLAAQVTGEGRDPAYVSVSRVGDDLLAETAGDRRLASGRGPATEGRRQLRALGWQRSKGDRYFRFERDRRHTDQVAHACLAALREVHGVVHPAFLGGDIALVEDPRLPRTTACEATEPSVAAFPTDRSELDALVRATLSADLGHPVKVDEDGDFPFVAGTAVVFVRVLDTVPVVRLFAELVVDVTDTARAAVEVEELNRLHPGVKFRLLDDRVHCERDVDAWPFAPQHLRTALTQLCELCSEIDGEVAERVGGRCFLAPPARALPYPAELELLLTGDPLRTRPRAELISKLCGDDVEQLRQWLRQLYTEQEGAADRLQEAVLTGRPGLVREREREYAASSRRYRRLARAVHHALGLRREARE